VRHQHIRAIRSNPQENNTAVVYITVPTPSLFLAITMFPAINRRKKLIVFSAIMISWTAIHPTLTLLLKQLYIQNSCLITIRDSRCKNPDQKQHHNGRK